MTVIESILGYSLVENVLRIFWPSLLAGVSTAIVTFAYRVRVRNKLPEGATLILGLGVVAIYLNTRSIFIQFIGGTGSLPTVSEAMLNVAVFVAAGIASYIGRYAGDKLGTSERLTVQWLRPNFSPIVRAAGRFITVTLPDEIDDIEGYDPVEDETKAILKGRKLDFPRGLTVTEIQSQIATRLKEEYDIGYVDVELTEDGTVEYLAVGQRAAGIGPTLPPKSAAVAVRADPPFSATPGDTVQLWRQGENGEERLGTAELRANVGTVTTVATEAAIAERIDPGTDYRLMTLAADSYPDREFAAMLRRGDETMSIFEISAESPLVGSTVGALEVTIIAIRSEGGGIDTIPARDRTIQTGDNLFAIGRPEVLRRIESSRGVGIVDNSAEPLVPMASIYDEENDEQSPPEPQE